MKLSMRVKSVFIGQDIAEDSGLNARLDAAINEREAARRSRACAYLADDHGPLAHEGNPRTRVRGSPAARPLASAPGPVHPRRRHRRFRRTPAARREVREKRRGRGGTCRIPNRNSSKPIPPSRSSAIRSCNTIRTGVDCERHNPFTLAGSRAATEPGERI